MRLLTAFLSTATLAGATLIAAPAHAADSYRPTVTIRAELDLETQDPLKGPKTFVARDVVVGAGAELSEADVQPSTADRWDGDIRVDVDPNTKRVTIYSTPDPENFESVRVWITSSELRFGELATDSFMQWTPSTHSVSGNTIAFTWKAPNGEARWLNGSTSFTYKHASSIAATVTSPKKKQVAVKVNTRTFGYQSNGGGTARVYEGTKLIKVFALLGNGSGSTSFTASKGWHTYKITYSGNNVGAPATVFKRVKVKK